MRRRAEKFDAALGGSDLVESLEKPTSVRDLLERAGPDGRDRALADEVATGPSFDVGETGETLVAAPGDVGRISVDGRVVDHPRPGSGRVVPRGKFLFVGDRKLYVRGVTYGPFRPDADGCEYPARDVVDRDFAQMAANAVNAVRTYTVPPRWLLDAAAEHGLWVMVGLPWAQHLAFLDDRAIRRSVLEQVRDGTRAVAGHPALLCLTVGNEIPASIVRWHGRRRIERFIRRLCRLVKAVDAETLVTYVNYPSTEYLHLPFLDFACFNVYLESRDRLEAYLARLQNLSGERPLVMAEVGLDSMRNGEQAQADTLAWQIRATFQIGCAGTFVFAWSDNWFRGGHDILDWAFGLTDRAGRPKPALTAVRDAFVTAFLPESGALPSISVVVCSYNGAATIRECLDAVTRLEYPDYEVLVVDDGSKDATAATASEYDAVRLVRIPNGGLSHARNVGLHEARGEIIAYVDDDAYPDPHWLAYLGLAFRRTTHVGIAGPNLAPMESAFVAECVSHSPGGPSHVLHTDVLAEHLPGCNMAFRRTAMLAIQGFDVNFRIAGDDVDLCWRLLERGGTLGFSAGALVWHHRRGTVRTYLKQQLNYGRAEAMLERKWPDKYNRLGHLRWAGHLYGKGHTRPLPIGHRVAHGVWGSRLFQFLYTNESTSMLTLTLMPEWYLVTAGLFGLVAIGFAWAPLFWTALPLALIAAALPFAQAVSSAWRVIMESAPRVGRRHGLRHVALTTILHVLQPVVRLIGRMNGHLTPWREHGVGGAFWPSQVRLEHWSETWRSANEWLETLERSLRRVRVPVRRGGDLDRWDLQVTCGLFGAARLITAMEEHGGGKQMVLVRVKPRATRFAVWFTLPFVALAVAAAASAAWIASAALAMIAAGSVLGAAHEAARAVRSIEVAVDDWPNE